MADAWLGENGRAIQLQHPVNLPQSAGILGTVMQQLEPIICQPLARRPLSLRIEHEIANPHVATSGQGPKGRESHAASHVMP